MSDSALHVNYPVPGYPGIFGTGTARDVRSAAGMLQGCAGTRPPARAGAGPPGRVPARAGRGLTNREIADRAG